MTATGINPFLDHSQQSTLSVPGHECSGAVMKAVLDSAKYSPENLMKAVAPEPSR